MLRPSDLTTCHPRGGRGGCGQSIRWTMTKAGKAFAVDPDPHPDGNTAVMRDAGGTLRSRRVTVEMPVQAYERLMMPHAATCKPTVKERPKMPPPSRPRPSQARAEGMYGVLGVARDADVADIRSAYRRLARALHPDKNPSAAARDRFKQVTEAYDVLSNPLARQLYDQTGRAPRGART